MPRKSPRKGFENWKRRDPKTMAEAEKERPKETPVESPKPEPRKKSLWTFIKRIFGKKN